jgi:predicted Zn-dependent protease
MSAPRPALPLLLGLLLAGSACTAARQAADAASDVATDALLPVAQENELGDQFKAELDKELKLHEDDELNRYVVDLGQKVAAAAKGRTPEGIRFRFYLVDDDETVNAFAIPGGHIYVYSGLMKKAENEAELIGVLGHEVAHVTERHVARRLIAAYGLDAVTKLALGEDPGLLGELVSTLVSTGVLLKYGRDQERESDRYGIPYTVGAGYDPQGFVTFFEKLKADEGADWLVLVQSHPLPSERVETAQALINTIQDKPSELGEERFAEMKAKL